MNLNPLSQPTPREVPTTVRPVQAQDTQDKGESFVKSAPLQTEVAADDVRALQAQVLAKSASDPLGPMQVARAMEAEVKAGVRPGQESRGQSRLTSANRHPRPARPGQGAGGPVSSGTLY